jgi:ABC-2 type transport system ATP-binding protein
MISASEGKRNMNIVEVELLRKNFGPLEAVKGISFAIGAGEIFGLLGPNGAGKSTTIKILVTLLKSSSGTARINGFDIGRESRRVRESLGIIFQDPSLDERLTAGENLYFHSKLYHVPPPQIGERIAGALRLVDLAERRDDPVLTFSGGMKRRLEIARGILHTPKVLFLDEPTIGLDPQTRAHIWDYLDGLRRSAGISMLLTTHYMEEAEICDRVAIIDHGEIIALDTPANLKSNLRKDSVTIAIDDAAAAAALIRQRFNVEAEARDGSVRIAVENGRTFVPRLFAAFPGRIGSVDIHTPSLEDVFIQLTGRTIRDEESSAVDRFRRAARVRGRR